MMKKMLHFAILAAIASAGPLHAASDTGLQLHDTGIGHRNTGLGVSASIRINLGPGRIVRKSERVKLGIAAGPVFVIPDADAVNGVKRGAASFADIELKPGYQTSVHLAGRPVIVDLTSLGAAEKGEDSEDGDRQNTGDKIAWVAAVAGGVMLALVGIYAASCGPGEDSSCGSD